MYYFGLLNVTFADQCCLCSGQRVQSGLYKAGQGGRLLLRRKAWFRGEGMVFLKYLKYCTSRENLSSTSQEECQEIVWLLKIALHQRAQESSLPTGARQSASLGDAETIMQQTFGDFGHYL